MKSNSIKVFGKVQGVGFRFYTHKKANELGVKGFVRNLRDGSVYVEAEAAPDIMDEFIGWLHQGPQWARVDEVFVQDVPEVGFERFEIR